MAVGGRRARTGFEYLAQQLLVAMNEHVPEVDDENAEPSKSADTSKVMADETTS